ncbi:DEAD/DEAH box helicase [Candidatus Woesearchaeota archaeon]|nr:DEAD/DEAH box helicase [Candidatus Woesearchaeota archaeon]
MTQITLQPELERARLELGYKEWTEIQEKTIPLIQQGKDVIGQSHTGSGKTAAFGFPLLEKTFRGAGLQVLILVPTRELCEQVSTEMLKFSKYKRNSILAVYGGVPIGPQIQRLPSAEVVVGTPGRILDHISRGSINLHKIRILVLDEADKMFEMGFIDDVKHIVDSIPRERQTLLFSATISQEIHDIVRHYMRQPEKVKIQDYVDKGKMNQEFYAVDSRDKFSLLVHIFKQEKPELAIIFCATRDRVDAVSRNLNRQGINANAIHGGLSQNRRKNALDMFHQMKVGILVASDVAARGLDIKNVSHVINYDIPRSLKEYVHRIGRTARAGSAGKVISLLSPMDHDNFRVIYDDSSLNIQQMKLPNFPRVPYVVSNRPFRQQRDFGGRSSLRPPRSFSRKY